ncbi:MAG: GTPase domain-containing protein [Deltaproteobacteria bacterium]|nr:GTPase domain-containing protein [Nannocystaceae bacterium]
MSYINHLAKEINCKIVYYGPGLCGKTANLQHIFEVSKPESKGKMISLATETDRTLFFDFLPIDLGSIRGYKVRFHLYTVPGQVFYDASRKLVLRGADGIVFVADSQPSRTEANIESLDNLEVNLRECNLAIDTVAMVVQYNKRDLADVMPVEKMREQLNPRGVPDFEATAKTGAGVLETLKGLSKLVLVKLGQKL